jgi:predicted ATPase
MLKKLRIQNFKGWEDTGELRMAPLTVFFGTNSSGKSSILQFLMMLKQTARSPDRNLVLNYGDKNAAVELGSFRDAVHMRSLKRMIEFDITWSLPKQIEIEDSKHEKIYSGDGIGFHAKIRNYKGLDYLERFEYQLLDKDEEKLAIGMRSSGSKISSGKYKVDPKRAYKLVGNRGRQWDLPSPKNNYDFPDEFYSYYQNTDVASDLSLEYRNVFNKMNYLGPLRVYPSRDYSFAGATPEEVGWTGSAAIGAVLAASRAGRKLSTGNRQRNYPFEVFLAQRLEELELIESFQAKEIGRNSQRYEVEVRVTKESPLVNMKDVGFGVSQILPVIVQCYYSKPDSIIIMEQPELHLHPRVQANLADSFITALRSKEDGADRNVQIVVESHSEHFLRRLQKRIAEEELTEDDVAIYFCDRENGKSVIEELEVDTYGNIRNWPENFFGDQFAEIADQQKRAIERQIEDRENVNGSDNDSA